MSRVLVVDDEWDAIRPLLQSQKANHGFQFDGHSEFSVPKVLEAIERLQPAILLLDILHAGNERPGEEEAGIRIFNDLGSSEAWQARKGSTQIVFFSSKATTNREWRIAKTKRLDLGGYVDKRLLLEGHPSALRAIRLAAEKADRYKRYPSLADPVRSKFELLYSPNSQAMEAVWERVLLSGRCIEPVLIQGATGTGKELVAKAIYEVMRSHEWPEKLPPGSSGFLAYNIGSAPQEGNLQYTELFGATRGAFTGAEDNRKGVFECATGESNEPGKTLFLDEIGDAPAIVQVALLRVLQEKKIVPLGGFNQCGQVEKKVKFRLITASHRQLRERVQEDAFRADLYYRLNTIEIYLPSLAERPDDIGVLLYHFVDKLKDQYAPLGMAKTVEAKDEQAIVDKLKQYHWPGNVRQLEMLIARSYVTSPGDRFVLSDDIDQMIAGGDPAPPENAEKILDRLAKYPTPLAMIANESGKPTAEAVYRGLLERLGRHPRDDEEAQAWFGPDAKADSVRRWASDHGIKSPKAKRQNKD